MRIVFHSMAAAVVALDDILNANMWLYYKWDDYIIEKLYRQKNFACPFRYTARRARESKRFWRNQFRSVSLYLSHRNRSVRSTKNNMTFDFFSFSFDRFVESMFNRFHFSFSAFVVVVITQYGWTHWGKKIWKADRRTLVQYAGDASSDHDFMLCFDQMLLIHSISAAQHMYFSPDLFPCSLDFWSLLMIVFFVNLWHSAIHSRFIFCLHSIVEPSQMLKHLIALALAAAAYTHFHICVYEANESMSCMLWVCDCNDMTCEFRVQFTRVLVFLCISIIVCVCVCVATWQSQSKNTINQYLVCSHFALWKPISVFLFGMQSQAHNRFTLKLFHFQNTHIRIQWISILPSENFIPFKFH